MSAQINSSRFDVFGVGVDPLDLSTAADAVLRAAHSARCSYACLCGAHGVVEARRDPRLAAAFLEADLVLADGTPIVWVGKCEGFASVDRVFGPELMLEVMERSQVSGERHFFLGGKPGVAEELSGRMKELYPRATIAGTYTPPFRPLNKSEEAELCAQLRACRPDIIWLGISTPKQELFMHAYRERLGVPVMIGVGAAFDFHTGRLHDSPRWIKRAGLQWLHRLAQEPRRLWRRYLKTNSIFIALALRGLMKAAAARIATRPLEQKEPATRI